MSTPEQSPEGARLVAALRELRGRTGLSLVALAGRTTYSKSSWERYLNGKKLPPRDAVESLCRIAGEPPGRCLALWELAELDWSGRAARQGAGEHTRQHGTTTLDTRPAAGTSGAATEQAAEASEVPSPSEDPPEPPRRGRRRAVVLASAVGAVVCAAAVAGALVFWPGEGEAEEGIAPGCRGAKCTGESPELMHCGIDPRSVVTTRPREGLRVDLRYGKRCGASWVRTWGHEVGDVFEVSAPGVRTQKLRIAEQYETEYWGTSPMVAVRDPRDVTVCHLPADGGERTCFDGGA
ncbi:XRE family transcriptional regulator [Streptomyces sp. HNM0574]|uniref:helix-turn-helix domain-containing protein n=1 Tax=Streptomyces sp. HNM0574 TaxID=2714954 RepID=UPI00146CB528|nr:XRE family transcriptional regulator [Streptomyces sp. HNM0574]NLU66823.1 DUF2690 domain-containing protein [Streptomyces sp. HNM0574]